MAVPISLLKLCLVGVSSIDVIPKNFRAAAIISASRTKLTNRLQGAGLCCASLTTSRQLIRFLNANSEVLSLAEEPL